MSGGVFVAIPTHDGRVHWQTMAGCMQALIAMPDRLRFDQMGGSFLPILRDKLTLRFLDSGADHMLCVDSDVGWESKDLEALLATGKDFVSGVYVKKQPDREIPARVLRGQDAAAKATEGALVECDFVPGGFLLIARSAIERMWGAYRSLQYNTELGTCCALWSSLFDPVTGYDGEDVAFCRRWRQIGGQVWLHTGVVLNHWGEFCYRPLPKT